MRPSGQTSARSSASRLGARQRSRAWRYVSARARTAPHPVASSARRRAAIAATQPNGTAPANATITPLQLLNAMLSAIQGGAATAGATQYATQPRSPRAAKRRANTIVQAIAPSMLTKNPTAWSIAWLLIGRTGPGGAPGGKPNPGSGRKSHAVMGP